MENTDTFKQPWLNKVEKAINTATSYTWDGCHKIYIMSDQQSHEDMIKTKYQPIKINNKNEAIAQMFNWWESSCGLRFISRIENGGHSNEDYHQVIPQFDYDDQDE